MGFWDKLIKLNEAFDTTLYMVIMGGLIYHFGSMKNDESQIELLLVGGLCSIGGNLYSKKDKANEDNGSHVSAKMIFLAIIVVVIFSKLFWRHA